MCWPYILWTRISVQHAKSSSKGGGRWHNWLELFSTFCGYTSQISKVSQFDTSLIEIGPVVNTVGKVGDVHEYLLTCHSLIGCPDHAIA